MLLYFLNARTIRKKDRTVCSHTNLETMLSRNSSIRITVFAFLAAFVVARSISVETEQLEEEEEDLFHLPPTEKFTTTTSRRDNIHKVKVELYYMPQCPGCRQLISTSFSEAFYTEGFLDMADVTFVPYGIHDIQHKNNSNKEEKDRKVFDNVVESCALDVIGRTHQQRQFEYIDCIDHSIERDASKVDRECAKYIGLSKDQIKDIEICASSHRGQALAEKNVWQSKAIGANYFPWVVVDREHSSEIDTLVWDSLFRYVCQVYSGPLRSDECDREMDDGGNDDKDFISEQL